MHIFNTWQFALFSANVHCYLPQFSWKDHQVLYKEWIDFHENRPLSEHLRERHVDRNVVEACRYPSIISVFHLGDHLAWPVLLARQGIHFNVVLDEDVYRNAKTVFEGLLRQLSAYGHTPELLFSNDPTLLLKIRSRKAKGQHLLCFADGASGSNTGTKDARVPIPFLNGKIWLKKGIPFISHLFGMPVLCLLPTSIGKKQYLHAKRIIAPARGEERDVYAMRCLQQLYGSLEKIVRKAPYRWECWGYLHRNGMLGKIVDQHVISDGNSLIQVPWDGEKIWFDRANYSARFEY